MTGQLPSGWTCATLGELFRIRDSERVPVNAKERSLRRGSVPYYGATGQVGWIDDHLFDDELILLGEDGAPFLQSEKPKAYIIRGKTWVNNHAHVLEALEGTPSEFWKYQLDQIDYRPFVSGTTRLKLSQAPMRRIPLRVAPLPEQQRIAARLDSYFSRLDDVVATLERVERNLKRYRASVLKAAVEGRLVPTEAELARQEGRDYEPADVLLRRILEERRSTWIETEAEKARGRAEAEAGKAGRPWTHADDDAVLANAREVASRNYQEPAEPDTSKLPRLPEGWCWTTVGQLLVNSLIGLVRGKSAQSSTGPGYRYVRMDCIDLEGRFELSRSTFVTATDEEAERFALQAGDILFNTRNSVELVGKACSVGDMNTRVLFNNNIMRLRFDKEVSPCFLGWQMCAPAFRSRMANVKRATTSVAAIYAKDLFPLPLALPPRAEAVRIGQEVDRLFQTADLVRRDAGAQVRRAGLLRKSVLATAFQGRLVEQNPEEEPAAALLERLRAAPRTGEPGARRGYRRDRKAAMKT